MRTRDIPFVNRVLELRSCLTTLENPASISDDSDMWQVSAFGTSPRDAMMDRNALRLRGAEAISRDLIRIGGDAAEAVAAGLRLQGVWRERLLPFARKYRAMPCIHDALVLVAVRRRDPLVEQAARILAGKRLLSAGELAARRRSRRRR